ncbi:MAG: OmpA family protein [Saprospiraceae bacterium]|nr:OmpA family protein [Saprospiraceae bacterium]
MTLLLASCVSTKKFDELAREKRMVEAERTKLQADIARQRTAIADLETKAETLVQVQEQLATTSQQKDGLENTLSDLQQQYDQLLREKQELVSVSGEEKAMLSGELAEKQKQIDQKERELRLLEKKLQSQEENLESLQEDVRIRERKLQDLMYELNEQDSIMRALRSTVTDALTGFSDADLTVSERNGKIYVSLSQNLLFAKGSNVLDNAGKSAIRKLAGVLKDHPDILINVEGHTDPDGTPAKNWDLSVSRATSVVKQLTASGLDPSQVTASGRAFYDPLVPNDVEENKAMNRRTEIILAPRLDVLYNLVEH